MGTINHVDLIYVNYNSTDCLIESIGSIVHCTPETYRLHCVVIDNASSQDLRGLTERFPDIHLTINPRNVGFGAAINQALALCRSPYIILLNPDTWIRHDFFSTAIHYLETHPQVGIVGPMILDHGGEIQGSARSFPTPLTSFFGRNSPITRLYPQNSITRANILTYTSDLTTPMAVDWVSGACMVVRRAAIEQIGGFDPRFFLYWEDTDLCRRIKEAGWQVVYLPEVKVIHIGSKSSNTRPVFSNFHFHRSSYRLYEKYTRWPLSIFTPMAAVGLMLRFLTAIVFNGFTGAVHRIRHSRSKPPLRKIRILRIISRMNIGGPSIHVKNLTEHLDPALFTTRLITGTVSPGEGDMGYITRFDKKVQIYLPELQREISFYRDFKTLVKVIQVIRRFQPHIVHSHTSKAGTISRTAVWICNLWRKTKIKSVHTFHGHVLEGYFSPFKSSLFLWIERSMAKATDVIIAISNSQQWELSNVYHIAPPEKITTIKLGFDLKPFQLAYTRKGAFRKKLGCEDDTVLIGIVGRLAPIKNHKLFLDAGKALLATHADANLKLVIIGDGEERQRLEKHTDGLGIRDQVIFTGWEQDIAMVYADLTILALTSLNEGTPVSVIEAMAAGVPVVGTNVGGIIDLLGPPQAVQPLEQSFSVCERGILCPKNDPAAFTSALHHVLTSGYLQEKRHVEEACRYVLENYSMERLIGDMHTLYSDLVGTPPLDRDC